MAEKKTVRCLTTSPTHNQIRVSLNRRIGLENCLWVIRGRLSAFVSSTDKNQMNSETLQYNLLRRPTANTIIIIIKWLSVSYVEFAPAICIHHDASWCHWNLSRINHKWLWSAYDTSATISLRSSWLQILSLIELILNNPKKGLTHRTKKNDFDAKLWWQHS